MTTDNASGMASELAPETEDLLEALRDVVDPEDLACAFVAGDPGGHLTDRPEAEDGDRATVGDRRVVDRLPGGGEDIGEE